MELARLTLPQLSRAAVENGFGEVRGDLLTIVERKERRAREVGERLERLRAAAAATRARRDAAHAEFELAKTRQQAVQSELARALESDVEFQNLSKLALQSEAELKRDEERVAEIAKEAREKLPAYERSRLFNYLLEQRFGSPDYPSRGLVRRLDRWVARLVEFDKASRSYRFLQTTPRLMDEETARRKAEFHSLMDRIERMELDVAGRLGVEAAVKAVEVAGKSLERMEVALADDEKRVRDVEAELATLDQEQGRFYEEALSRLRTFLSQASTALLEHRASATPDPQDDEVTLRIRVLSDDIAAMSPRLARQTEHSREAARVSDGLGHLARRFEQSNFHELRSFFADGYDIQRSIDLFRAGTLTRDAFWDEIKRHQERVPTEFEKRASEKIAQAMNSPLPGRWRRRCCRWRGWR